MLYEALTGSLPFEGPPVKTLVAKKGPPPPPPGTLVAGVPEDLNRLVAALLNPDPTRRPHGNDVAAWTADSVHTAPVSPPWSRGRAFVGREREIDEMRAHLAAARAHSVATVIHLRGPSGIGKSALLGELSRRVEREEGALVLSGRCHPQESVPWKGLDGIVEGLSQYLASLSLSDAAALRPSHASALARLFPVLQAAQGWDPEPAADELGAQELPLSWCRGTRLPAIAGGGASTRLALD